MQGTNNGVLKDGASFKRGIVGPGFLFDGVNDYVQIPNDSSLNPGTSDFTFEFWVNTRQTTDAHILAKRSVCSLSSFYVVSIHSYGGITLEMAQDTSGNNYNVVDSFVPVNDGAWHHVAAVREGVTGSIYIDGVLSASASTPGITNISNGRPLTIGTSVCDRPFGGMIDELSYYNSALPASTIAAIYAAGGSGKCKPELFVSSITPSYEVVRHGFLVSTSVVIQDENGIGIENASVEIKTILPSGSVIALPGTTDATGEATISFASSDNGLYKFTVQKVSLPGREYDRSLNIETSDTLLIP